ncbi:MAG: Cysteine desulfurase IscS [Chlamydiae bacterium]|nr:Cysteine desulfurase IscS [Chlamydiota bacterium]
MKEIYLDNHTTTAPYPKVIEVMKPYLTKRWGNYLQPHQKGQELISDIHKAYEKIYDLIGADISEDELFFVSNSEEAISTVYQIVYQESVQNQGKNHFLTLAVEDASILMNLKKLESLGCSTFNLDLNEEGLIQVDKIAEAITPRTALVSLSLAHGLTGLIQPIEKLKELCKLRGIFLHLDISYAIGKMDLDIHELGADFITFGGDKFHGPKSSGILYVHPGVHLHPLILGGIEQKGVRGGILDVSQLAGLSEAARIAKENISDMGLEIASLRDLFESNLSKGLDEVEIVLNQSMRLPNVSVIAFKNIVADALLYSLNQKKVYASLGGVQFQRLSNILDLLQFSPVLSNGALSFAMSCQTTAEDVNSATEIIIEEVKKIRLMTKNMEPYSGS